MSMPYRKSRGPLSKCHVCSEWFNPSGQSVPQHHPKRVSKCSNYLPTNFGTFASLWKDY